MTSPPGDPCASATTQPFDPTDQRYSAPATGHGERQIGPRSFLLWFHHPTWGEVRMVVAQWPGPSSACNWRAGIDVIDASGAVRYRWSSPDGNLQLRPAGASTPTDPATVRSPFDATGNVFLIYNPGRYDGVIVLHPRAGGFTDLRTLPGRVTGYAGAFYGAAPHAQTNGDYEIVQQGNDVCTPSCAQGHTSPSVTYRWTGSAYAPIS